MEEETNKVPEKPEEKGWAEKAKKLIDKADEFIDEKVDKVKKSKAFGEFKDHLTRQKTMSTTRSKTLKGKCKGKT